MLCFKEFFLKLFSNALNARTLNKITILVSLVSLVMEDAYNKDMWQIPKEKKIEWNSDLWATDSI